MPMTYADLLDFTFSDWSQNTANNKTQHTPILLLGPPGIGKSSLGETLAHRMTQHMRSLKPDAPPASFLALDLTSMAQEDLVGVPTVKLLGDNKYTEFAPQTWWIPFTQPDSYGVLILDDISAAHKDVQIAVRQLVLYRRVGQVELSKNVYILITGNRRDDQSGATVLPAHFRNSSVILSLEPDLQVWNEWFLQQKDTDPLVSAYLQFKPSNFSLLPKDADAAGAFPTPRTWHKLSKFLHDHPQAKDNIVGPIVMGLVGEGPGSEFLSFRRINKDITAAREVLINPLRALPNAKEKLHRMDLCYGMAIGLSYEASWLLQNPEKSYLPKENSLLISYFKAVVHCFSHKREMVSLCFSQLCLMTDKARVTELFRQNANELKTLLKEDRNMSELFTLITNDLAKN